MLKDGLYTIERLDAQGDSAMVCVRLNISHAIYQGHFPGHPITPGVCLLQIAKELLSYITHKEYSIVSCKNIKYLNIIDPMVHPVVAYQLQWSAEGNGVKLKASIVEGDLVFSKMSMELE